MSKQPNILFLEEWLRNKCGGASKLNPRNSNSPSARAIIQAWADLRDSAKYESFTLHHLQSLKILVNSQTSVHVADPQAKLLVAILSSPNHSLPYESYPLMFRLLYIWVRKTLKPTSAIIDSVVEVLSHLISVQFDSRKDPFFFSEVILLLGAISSVLSSPERSKTTCLDILSGLLIKEYQFLGLFTELVPDVLAGIGGSGGLKLTEINEHLDNILFKEAGAITGIFCNQYVSADEEHKDVVENLIWKYCQDLYFGYRQVALFFKGKEDKHLEGLGKIAESAFLMIVVFTLAVTKHKLNSKFTQEMQMDVSLKILVSFSCVEYFRHVRLPEYIEIIRKVVANVKENEHFCTSFVKSMPSYVELTNSPEFTLDQKTKYIWSKDEVQTARILFYLRVIPTCVEHLPSHVFRNMVVPTMFLYMEHPNGKVARASHSLFMAFISFGEESEMNGRLSLKEQLVFYYIERSLLGYPGITPFEGMASGVIGIVRHLPAGSPSIFYCINNLVEKADMLCAEVLTNDADAWKKLQGETEPCKRLLDLLLHIVFLVDIQVLVDLMKLLAQLITKLPQDAQNMVLNELYSQVAECDDVVRKPTLVSWLQSLSYLCKKASQENEVSAKTPSEDNFILACAADPSSWFKLASRL
ncbi:uncharacterized protein LOC129298014 isoform X4 [Prosopis cineraria]|uniref:uncharacterized protein LOC129298014 isoform X4 n=1 Tax=Prosopis cineraria TaxID=364024 RepID=UPI00240FE62A|nr:uncharacterized protein LOC129298014 isoform X4 [Prosopis cineraria]